MSSIFNTLEGYITAPFEAVGKAIYDSPIVGDGLHMVDNMFVLGRDTTRVLREESTNSSYYISYILHN